MDDLAFLFSSVKAYQVLSKLVYGQTWDKDPPHGTTGLTVSTMSDKDRLNNSPYLKPSTSEVIRI